MPKPGRFVLRTCLYSGTLLVSDMEGCTNVLPGLSWDLQSCAGGGPRLDLPCSHNLCFQKQTINHFKDACTESNSPQPPAPQGLLILEAAILGHPRPWSQGSELYAEDNSPPASPTKSKVLRLWARGHSGSKEALPQSPTPRRLLCDQYLAAERNIAKGDGRSAL